MRPLPAKLPAELAYLWPRLGDVARADALAGRTTPVLREAVTSAGARFEDLGTSLFAHAKSLDLHFARAARSVAAGTVAAGFGGASAADGALGLQLPRPTPERVLQELTGQPVERFTEALTTALAGVKPGDSAAASAAVATVAKELAAATGLSPKRAGKLLTSALALPHAARHQLLSLAARPQALSTRPLVDVIHATLLNALSAVADKARMEPDALAIHVVTKGDLPESARAAAAQHDLGALAGPPRLVQDSRFESKVELPFERGTVLMSPAGAVHSVRTADNTVIPGDLLGALPKFLARVARNLGGGAVVIDAATQERGRSLLAQAWMAKEGLLDVHDAFVVGLTPKAGEPERFMYRMKEGTAWRPVPDTSRPVYYVGPEFLGDDGVVLASDKLLPWQSSFHDDIKDLKQLADPALLGMTGPGESLPATNARGEPHANDFTFTARTGPNTHVALVIRRGDTGTYATAGGFRDKEEQKRIDAAKRSYDDAVGAGASPAELKARRGAWMQAMFATALREMMEEAFGKANQDAPAIVKLREGFNKAVMELGDDACALQLIAEGPVNGDYRRTAFGGMFTHFVSLAIDVDLFRDLERLAQGTDDAKFAGAIVLVDNGRVGPLVNSLDMPFHHGMVAAAAERCIAAG